MPVPVDKAMQMVEAAHKRAVELDIAVTAVVVDESGRLVALGRMDRARPITADIATNRAFTAASFQQPTEQLAGVAGQAWFQSRCPRAAAWSARWACRAARTNKTSNAARRQRPITSRTEMSA
jgi:uncharacterized protein GlcG (DUF336 family)